VLDKRGALCYNKSCVERGHNSTANLENDTEKRKKSHSEAEEILLKKEKEQSDSERVKRLKEDWKTAGFGESAEGK